MSAVTRFAAFALCLCCCLGAAAQPSDDAFRAAWDAARRNDAEALAALAPKLAGHPLQAYVDYWRLSLRLNEALPEEVRAFFARYPDSPLTDRLRQEWLRQLGRSAWWEPFRTDYPQVAQPDTELLCYWLQARLAAGDSGALAEARPLWFSASAQPESCAPLFDRLIVDGRIGVGDLWARLRMVLEAGNLALAKQLSSALPEAAPLIPAKALDAAAKDPQRFLDRTPPDITSRAGRELAIFALTRLARSDAGAAATRFEDLAERFPADERGYVWGQIAYRGALNHEPGALAWYAKAGDAALSDQQIAWQARSALRQRNWPALLAAIERMSEAERKDPAWRYWKARALQAKGQRAEAAELLAALAREAHFYGILAAEDIGAPLPRPAEAWKPAEADIAAVGELPGIQRALLLNRLGLTPEATREWLYAVRGFDDRRLLSAAELAQRAGWFERSINTAERTRELHDYNQRYPMPFREVFAAQARASELDEAWLYGLARQESRFMPDARSRAGALGLMQVMPATARWIAKRWGNGSVRPDELTDVRTNVALGTWYLRYGLDNLGHAVLATAGYNAGPNRARRWRAETPLEGAIYAETIPFTETRDYVKKVMANATLYAAQLGAKHASLKERLGIIPGLAHEDLPPLTQETAQAPDLKN